MNRHPIKEDRIAQVLKRRVTFPDSKDAKYIGVIVDFSKENYNLLDTEFKLIDLPGRLKDEILLTLSSGCTLSDLEMSIMKVAAL